MSLLSLAGRAAGIPVELLLHSRQIAHEEGFEYGAGLVAWFLCFSCRLRVPEYNIYHLVPAGALQKNVIDLLATRINDYRIAKQYFLLKGGTVDEEMRTYLGSILNDKLRGQTGLSAKQTGEFQPVQGFLCLCEVVDQLAAFKIDAFPISGTLLGLVRDGQLLAHDYDIDLGVLATQADIVEVADLLRSTGRFQSVYKLEHRVQARHTNGTVVDIFLHYEEGGRYWHGSMVHRWYNTKFELRRSVFSGREFLVPDPPERYLEENYGDWEQRPLFWDHSFDTPNREFAPTRRAAFYLAERVLNGRKKVFPDRFGVEKSLDSLQRDFLVRLP